MKILLLIIAMAAGSSEDTSTPEYRCINGDNAGIWKTFNNGCADNCQEPSASPFGRACSKAITDSCDCGENHCWDGENCVENP